MNMRTTARLFSAALLILGLISGCASTEEATDDALLAAEAIADAKAANAEAKALNAEWNGTGTLIAEAEEKLAAGDTASAIALANEAEAQARAAIEQANAANKQFLNENAERLAMEEANARGAMAGRVSSYSVVRGDNLWSISGKDEVYADPYQWPLIYKTTVTKSKMQT